MVVEAGCPVTFVTNATLLAPELSERMPAYAGPQGWNHVTVSIDAAEPELFERLRRGARFEAVVSNLEAVREAKSRGVHLALVPGLKERLGETEGWQ